MSYHRRRRMGRRCLVLALISKMTWRIRIINSTPTTWVRRRTWVSHRACLHPFSPWLCCKMLLHLPPIWEHPMLLDWIQVPRQQQFTLSKIMAGEISIAAAIIVAQVLLPIRLARRNANFLSRNRSPTDQILLLATNHWMSSRNPVSFRLLFSRYGINLNN